MKTKTRHPNRSINIGTTNAEKIDDPNATARELVPATNIKYILIHRFSTWKCKKV